MNFEKVAIIKIQLIEINFGLKKSGCFKLELQI